VISEGGGVVRDECPIVSAFCMSCSDSGYSQV